MTTPTISIIIPVYNAAHYLRQCFDSILCQTFDHYEVILIDDGSTDGSGVICDQYCTRDHRFTVIHQKNQGSSSARNRGLDICKGEYICFIDADDWVATNHLQNLYDTISEHDADVAISSFYFFDSTGEQHYYANHPSDLSAKNIILEGLRARHHTGVVFKLFRSDLICDQHIFFPKFNYFEDMCFSISTLLKAKKIAFTPTATYYYRYNNNSQTHNKDATKRAASFQEFAENLSNVFDQFNLWEDDDLKSALMERINKEKIQLLKGNFNKDSKDVLRHYYPDSYRVWKISSPSDYFYRLSIKYTHPLFIRILAIFSGIKQFIHALLPKKN